jgi:hypothetical protein
MNYVNLNSEIRCNTPVKYMVKLYKNQKGFNRSVSVYIASCYISPANMEGEVFISSLKDAK